MSTYLSFNSDANKYSSRRSVVYGKNGMVCTSQTLAAQAGLDILKNGGNAIDAAIATAISLTVLEPPSNGIGSDLFALVWYKGKLYGLNGSGPAPASLTREKVLAKLDIEARVKAQYSDSGEILDLSVSDMPDHGWETVTVPGAPISGKRSTNGLALPILLHCLMRRSATRKRGFLCNRSAAGYGRRMCPRLPD